jgi:hypothetical protein
MGQEHGVAGIDPHKVTATVVVIEDCGVDGGAGRSLSTRPGSTSC